MISIGRSEKYLVTPNGNPLKSDQTKLIETIVYEIQKFSDVEISNNVLVGEPLEKISLYSLLCTQIDFCNDALYVPTEHEVYNHVIGDPITNLSPGPERVDQIHQWRDIIRFLENRGHEFSDVQYYKEDKTPSQLLASDLKNYLVQALPFERAIYNNLSHITGSALAAWAMCSNSIEAQAFAAAMSQTATAQLHICDSDEIDPKREMLSEFVEMASVCKNFIALSQSKFDEDKKLLSLQENLTHEYKASLRTPYPNGLDSKVDDKGKTYFPVGDERFSSIKLVRKYIERQTLKAIVGLLNAKGGTLVIGVHEKDDVKTRVGIDFDEFESTDRYQLHLIQLIDNRIGKFFSGEFIEIEFINFENQCFCVVRVSEYRPNDNQYPAMLDQEECFVRTGAKTDPIVSRTDLMKFSDLRRSAS
mgnify:CR=1 FL=1